MCENDGLEQFQHAKSDLAEIRKYKIYLKLYINLTCIMDYQIFPWLLEMCSQKSHINTQLIFHLESREWECQYKRQRLYLQIYISISSLCCMLRDVFRHVNILFHYAAFASPLSLRRPTISDLLICFLILKSVCIRDFPHLCDSHPSKAAVPNVFHSLARDQ